MTIDIKTKLTLDSNAKRELAGVKKEFKGTAEAAKEASVAASGFVKQVAAVALGTALPGLIKGTFDMAKGWLTAANAAYDQEQALAGLYATMKELPWKESRQEAEKMRRSLLDMATEIGQAPDEVYRGFQKLLMFVGDATDESFTKARQQTEQMTVLANVMGLNVEALAMEFGAMHDGVVRTRGPLFQLLKGTDIFGDNIAEATTNWRKLSDEARKELLSDALEKQAKKIGKATPTISDLVNTFEGMKQLFIEEIGAPVIRSLLPVLKDLKDELKAARPTIEAFAQAIGKDLAQNVIEAAKWLRESFEWIVAHKQEIKDDLMTAASMIKDAFLTAKEVVTWIIANKNILIAIWGVSKVPAMIGGVSAAAGVAKALPGAAAAAGGAAMKLGGVIGGTGGGAALSGLGTVAAGVGLASFAVAIAGVGAAAYQASQLYSENMGDMSEASQDAAARMARASEAYNKGNLLEARKWAEKAAAYSTEGQAMSAKMLAAIQTRMVAEEQLRSKLNAAIKDTNLKDAVDVYNKAVLSGNREMQQAAASFIQGTGDLVDALKEGKLKIAGGMEALTAAAEKEFEDFEKSMQAFIDEASAAMPDPSAMATGIFARKKGGRIRFGVEGTTKRAEKKQRAGRAGGGITVNKMEIHQEFRDQDPDRIAIVFQRDVVNAAIKRVMTNRATVFGI